MGLCRARPVSFAIALGAKPDAIPVATDPPSAIDVDALIPFAGPPLQLVEQDERVDGVVVHGMTLDVGEGRLAVFVRQARHEGWQVLRRVTSRGRLVVVWVSSRRVLSLRDGRSSERQAGDQRETG
jgi:hypothetical protein